MTNHLPVLPGFILFLLLGCTSPEVSQKKQPLPNTPELVKAVTPGISLAAYVHQLGQLNRHQKESFAQALEIFNKDFNKAAGENDQAFAAFFVFQRGLLDSLNQNLYRAEDYEEEINSLMYADSTLITTKAKVFEKELQANSLSVGSEEGNIYIQPDWEKVGSIFNPYISPAGQQFLKQIALEQATPAVMDAGIVVPLPEVVERLIFWEDFNNGNPDYPLHEYVTQSYGFYLEALLHGMDNTPAISIVNNQLDPEFLKAFKFIMLQYPKSKSAALVRGYQAVLVKHQLRESEESRLFLKKQGF